MTLVHAAIGLGEAVITGLVLRYLLLARPDLVYDAGPEAPTTGKRAGQAALAGLAVALAVAVFLAPFASDHPDGLEWVGGQLGFLKDAAPLLRAPLADYQVPALAGHIRAATAVAGLAGTLVVFVLGLALARIFSRPSQEGLARDAA
jgi:cobalt/nickel transport system permease protein